MTWPWIFLVSGNSFAYVVYGNRSGCKTRASFLSSNCSIIPAYSLSWKFLLGSIHTPPPLCSWMQVWVYWGDTSLFPAVRVCSVWFMLQTSPTADLKWQNSPIKSKAVSATALWKSSRSQGLKCWPHRLVSLVQLSSAAPKCAKVHMKQRWSNVSYLESRQVLLFSQGNNCFSVNTS